MKSPGPSRRALATAEYYGLNLDDAKGIVGEIGRAVLAWRGTAEGLGASTEEIMRMESAFAHEDLDEAAGYGTRFTVT